MSDFSIESILGLKEQSEQEEATSNTELEQATSSSRPRKRTTCTGSSAGSGTVITSDDGGNQPSKRKRTAFNTHQIRTLENYFMAFPYPDAYRKKMIANLIGISTAKVQVWFQNRRARYRKREYPHHPLQRSLFSPTHPLRSPTNPLQFQPFVSSSFRGQPSFCGSDEQFPTEPSSSEGPSTSSRATDNGTIDDAANVTAIFISSETADVSECKTSQAQ